MLRRVGGWHPQRPQLSGVGYQPELAGLTTLIAPLVHLAEVALFTELAMIAGQNNAVLRKRPSICPKASIGEIENGISRQRCLNPVLADTSTDHLELTLWNV